MHIWKNGAPGPSYFWQLSIGKGPLKIISRTRKNWFSTFKNNILNMVMSLKHAIFCIIICPYIFFNIRDVYCKNQRIDIRYFVIKIKNKIEHENQNSKWNIRNLEIYIFINNKKMIYIIFKCIHIYTFMISGMMGNSFNKLF